MSYLRYARQLDLFEITAEPTERVEQLAKPIDINIIIIISCVTIFITLCCFCCYHKRRRA